MVCKHRDKTFNNSCWRGCRDSKMHYQTKIAVSKLMVEHNSPWVSNRTTKWDQLAMWNRSNSSDWSTQSEMIIFCWERWARAHTALLYKRSIFRVKKSSQSKKFQTFLTTQLTLSASCAKYKFSDKWSDIEMLSSFTMCLNQPTSQIHSPIYTTFLKLRRRIYWPWWRNELALRSTTFKLLFTISFVALILFILLEWFIAI
jgi:hypothetical protein